MQHSHPLTPAELGQYPRRYEHGLAFHTVICQGDRYLPWLQRRLEEARLWVVEKKAPHRLVPSERRPKHTQVTSWWTPLLTHAAAQVDSNSTAGCRIRRTSMAKSPHGYTHDGQQR